MTEETLQIEAVPLRLALKSTVRHNAATRNEGESIWVQAKRRHNRGYGEGCPRVYVAGDTLKSSLQWIRENFSNGQVNFVTLEDVQQWAYDHEQNIDRYPSAWCAVEMAMLDLLAREENCSVEKLLQLDGFRGYGRYTAVMGDDKGWKYAALADQYLIRGLRDFKIKLSGNLERDLEKMDLLETLSMQHQVPFPRIRLDANNLWKNHCDEAVAYTQALGIGRIFAMEEPVEAGHVEEISKFSMATGLPVILDESLCTLKDLGRFKTATGQFIANIKISKLGGLIRALRIIHEIKKLGWPIIVGCHVGETSLLTRAAFVASSAAGENLTAQEGAFGDYLVKREPVEPMLKFGRNGILDLRSPYYLKTVQGLKVIPAENWNVGFGMQGHLPHSPDDGAPDICFLEMPDQYKIHYRRWGHSEGENVALLLHGDMGHSGWLAPLASRLRSLSPELTVIAADRRGCGLNEQRGDLRSVQAVIEDVIQHIKFLKRSFKQVHLAGWGQGAQYAAVAGTRMGNAVSSLILLTPGFFWNERFQSVVRMTRKIAPEILAEFKLKPERNHACIPIPMEATDFTLVDEWLDFIEKDHLKTTMVTLKSVSIMDEIQELSWGAIPQNHLPTLVMMGQQDRIVDNRKVLEFIGHLFQGKNRNRLVTVESGHAIHFEKTEEVASEIVNFIRKL